VKKLWSISTTVRNPERLRAFLSVLKQLEGSIFNKETQSKYQILLIKERVYKPKNIPERYRRIFDDYATELPLDIAEAIFRNQQYEDPPMRGRQSVNPLNKLGFCIAKESCGPIIITELGNRFIAEDADISYVLFKSLLKLQFPNPISPAFNENIGFNIRPMIAAMHLLRQTNGLTQEEFSLFIPTLINYQYIDTYHAKIMELRGIKSATQRAEYIEKFLTDFYGVENLSETQKKNPSEYGDNIMRYFRLTKYFRVDKGIIGPWKIILEPTRKKEIEQILTIYDGKALKFDLKGYIGYMSDINKPELPWELDAEKSIEVITSLRSLIQNQYEHGPSCLKKQFQERYGTIMNIKVEELPLLQKEKYINDLRRLHLDFIQFDKDIRIKRNADELKKYICILNSPREYRALEPVDLEFVISQCFKIINDEISIKPNFITDDEGNPIGHAPGNRADIEGYYRSFNIIFEVTLDVSRAQVYRESVPVMRHLKNFEENNQDKRNFCVFIAPKIHDDTVNYFWIALRYGFEGTRQRIVPLNFSSFLMVLDSIVSVIENGEGFSHQSLYDLFDNIVSFADTVSTSVEWVRGIPRCINDWKLLIAQRN